MPSMGRLHLYLYMNYHELLKFRGNRSVNVGKDFISGAFGVGKSSISIFKKGTLY